MWTRKLSPVSFREELLELIGEKQGKQHHGEELRESDEQKAERLRGEMLIERGGLDGSGIATAPERRPKEGTHGGAIA
ncbi:MAG TPA: hypothetical protein VN887_10315 [Candidatus Angelobacter sp.]|nr:hypothetical protein [Candidatus Angelobacter sp.]